MRTLVGACLSLITTSTFALFFPRFDVAVIVTLPTLTGVTTPFLTVAIFLLLLFHVTLLTAVLGYSMAFRRSVSLLSMVIVPVRFSLSIVGIVGSITVNFNFSFFLLVNVTVIVAFPALTAFTTPLLLTVATLGSLLLYRFAVFPARSILNVSPPICV